MCLCNIDNPVEFMNEIASEDQRDPPVDTTVCIKCKRSWREVFICCDDSCIDYQVRHVNGICTDCHREFHAGGDKPTAEANPTIDIDDELDRAMDYEARLIRAKLELFDDLVKVIDELYDGYARVSPNHEHREIWTRAVDLQLGKLP